MDCASPLISSSFSQGLPTMSTRLLPLLLLPLLVACSDERVSFEIEGRNHSLSLIRIVTFPWEKTAEYALVAARMPDCMRRHALPRASLKTRVEVFSPGDNAWIIRQNGRMYVTETRECTGFAPLGKDFSGDTGPLVGTFEMKGEKLVFTPAPKADAAPAQASQPVGGKS